MAMDKSIFTDKNKKPGDSDLAGSLGDTFVLWQKIIQYVFARYPYSQNEWNYPGEKYGWSYRIKYKDRIVLYLLPRQGFFKAAFVFGQKATDIILKSTISESIRTELEEARVYTEGRGIRIDIRNEVILKEINALIDIKIAN
jgi:hypothetical protein